MGLLVPGLVLFLGVHLLPAVPRRGRPEDRLQRLPAGDALHALLKHLPG